jgi:hypothetical protein
MQFTDVEVLVDGVDGVDGASINGSGETLKY